MNKSVNEGTVRISMCCFKKTKCVIISSDVRNVCHFKSLTQSALTVRRDLGFLLLTLLQIKGCIHTLDEQLGL